MRLRPGQLWKCPKGHVLGMIIRNGSGRPMLVLYRNAMDPPLSPPAGGGRKEPPPASPLTPLASLRGAQFTAGGEERTPSYLPPVAPRVSAEAAGVANNMHEVDVMGVVDLKDGAVHDIRCSICGAMKPWVGRKGRKGE